MHDSTAQMTHEFEGAILRSLFVGATSPYLVVRVRRTHLISDTLLQMSLRKEDLKTALPLAQKFVTEHMDPDTCLDIVHDNSEIYPIAKKKFASKPNVQAKRADAHAWAQTKMVNKASKQISNTRKQKTNEATSKPTGRSKQGNKQTSEQTNKQTS